VQKPLFEFTKNKGEKMKQFESLTKQNGSRRSFLKKGALGAGATAIAAGLLPGRLAAFGQAEDDGAPVTKGDIAILTFLSALEQVEADLWIQYAELGGPNPKVPGAQGLSPIDLQLNGKSISTGPCSGLHYRASSAGR
jgi:hypothetical protein